MTQEYLLGFCKTAENFGIDSESLVKLAARGFSDSAKDILSSVADAYSSMSPTAKRTLFGTVGGGLASLILQRGEDGRDKLRKALVASALGGLGTYAADKSGAWNSLIDTLHSSARF